MLMDVDVYHENPVRAYLSDSEVFSFCKSCLCRAGTFGIKGGCWSLYSNMIAPTLAINTMCLVVF